MSYSVVIPARWNSSRFPGKALAEIDGLPMVVRTAYRAAQAEAIDRVVVATDDHRIADACRQYEIEAVLTACAHETGTDRVAEACRTLGLSEVINVQGDEPLIDPQCIDTMVRRLSEDSWANVANAACPLAKEDEDDKNVVKAVRNHHGHLMFLSRYPLPFFWEAPMDRLRHLGLYAFRGDALNRYAARSQGPVERAERIEMHRFLEYGDPVVLVEMPPVPPAVDIPNDLDKLQNYVYLHGGWSLFGKGSER